jgi:hypothetical protein
MIGLVMGKTWQQTLICLKNGGTPEVCSQKTGLSLELTQFWAQTDLSGSDGGQIKVKVIFRDGPQSFFLNQIQIGGALFGTDPLAGIEIVPGRTVFLNMGPRDPAEGIPHLGRFPLKGDTGFEVLMLQQGLTVHGFPTKTDGHWGDETEQHRLSFAASVGLLTFHVPHHSDDHFATIERVWDALRLPLREGGVPGLPGRAGVFPDG